GTSETTARAARYLWLEQTRIESGATMILTAHHSDDQVETVLMRVLSGSGPAGLAGMLPRNGRIVRPLLPFRRKELVQYLLDRGISFWEDPSNRDRRHLRSWIRDSVLPGLEARIPELRNRLSEVASQANLNRNAWDALVTADVVLNWREDHGVASVAASSLRTYDSPLAVALIMAVARRSGLVLGPASAHRLCAFAGVAASGSALDLSQGWRAELSFGRLRIVPPASDNIPDSLGFATMQGSTRWGSWGIDWMTDEAPTFQKRNGTSAWFIPGSVAVRSWRPGDRISPLGGRGHRPVVRCFQDAQISVTARRRWPVFNDRQGGVLWVPGVCRSSAGIPAPGAEALRVDVIHD
ncbi:MAG: tRNA lysidine(34) synthetase TilS, partial [Gemmatimonadota bacterium]